MRLYLFMLSLLLLLGTSNFVIAQSDDTKAPEISNVTIATTTEDSVTLTWLTNEKADSSVNYGLQPDYGIVRVPVADRTTHSVTLNNLESGRVYYFRVVSADAEGNQGISADYKIQTEGTPAIGEGQSESEPTKEIIEQIKDC